MKNILNIFVRNRDGVAIDIVQYTLESDSTYIFKFNDFEIPFKHVGCEHSAKIHAKICLEKCFE